VAFEGQPVAGAVVRVTTGAMNLGDWTLASLPADRAGRFDFGPVPAGRYHVRAEAPGRVAADEVVDLRQPDPRPLPAALGLELLPCHMRVHGTVRDGAGGVIARARVRAASFEFANLANAVADDQGHYTVCARTGTVQVDAAADGYGAAFVRATGTSD